MPRVSVIVSVYNCEEFIGETIQSIIDQTFTDWEFIIIDDNSCDKSASIIEEYAQIDARIRFVRNETNKGQCANLNYGIQIATGEYIAHTDHDDLSYPTRLEKQIEYMENNPQCLLCGCKYDIWSEGKVHYTDYWETCTPNYQRFRLPMHGNIGHSTFFWRRQKLVDLGITYGEWKYAEDYDLLLHVLEAGEVGVVPEKLVTYRVFPNQVTQTIGSQIIRDEIQTIRLEYIKNAKGVDNEIWEKETRGELITQEDFKRWEAFLEKYANMCGITSASLVKEINWVKYKAQKMTWTKVKSYALSKWRYSWWYVVKLIRMQIKHKLIHSNQ